jgi:uncharacterized protein (TIGR03437 family)
LKLTACLLGVALAICADAGAQTVTSVQNPASNTLAGLPNYGIAQGSIFILYGSGLGPATLVEGTTPYSTSLAGTSIQISTGDLFKVYSPYIVYTSATQVAAIMPSNVPAASASIEVFYNGQASRAFDTTVVANNFGISTMNQTGNGPAVITVSDFDIAVFRIAQQFQCGDAGEHLYDVGYRAGCRRGWEHR